MGANGDTAAKAAAEQERRLAIERKHQTAQLEAARRAISKEKEVRAALEVGGQEELARKVRGKPIPLFPLEGGACAPGLPRRARPGTKGRRAPLSCARVSAAPRRLPARRSRRWRRTRRASRHERSR